MSDIEYNPVVWVSLASVSGLSLISLGQPGLRTDLDEQVYTGGLTAVQAMLGGEVGGDTDRFVGGSHSNRTGRFLVRNDKGGELVGQVLLISAQNLPVANELFDHYEVLVTNFADRTLNSELYTRIEREFRTLGVNDVLDIFFESIKDARKKKSINLNGSLFSEALTKSTVKSVNDFEYSSTLVKIAEFKGKYNELSRTVKEERDQLLQEFTVDILELLTSDHPHALVMYPKLSSLKKDLYKLVRSEVSNLEVTPALKEIIQDFEENDLVRVLADFALHEVNKANLRKRLELEIFKKFQKEFPLLFLVDPEISGFKEAIENLTVKINENYDLAGTLTRLTHNLMKGREAEEALISPFIRHFCEQFSTGLTLSAWKYMQIIFALMTGDSNIDVADLLPNIKDEIPESHFKILERMMTKYKITKIDPVSFNVKTATDILPFYRALLSSLGFGINTLISDIALSENNPNNLLRHTVRNFKDFSVIIFNTYAIFEVYLFLESVRSKFKSSLTFPHLSDFETNFDLSTMDPEILLKALISANITNQGKEHDLVKMKVTEFDTAFKDRIKDIERFLNKSPRTISTGYKFDSTEVSKLNFSNNISPSVKEDVEALISEYEKIKSQITSDLDNMQLMAKAFTEGEKDEKKLNSTLKDTKFLSKSEQNIEKAISKLLDNIDKKYSSFPADVEKQLKGYEKEITKRYYRSCQFLNIDRKAFQKQNKDSLPKSSGIRNDIQSSINQIMKKNSLFTFDDLGYNYFYARNRFLPLNLETEVTNAIIHKKSLPFLREALDSMKEDENLTLYKAYAEIMENYAKSLLSELLGEVTIRMGKNFLRSDPDVYFIEREQIPIPTMELGVLTSPEAMDSLRNILGQNVAVESETVDNNNIFHVSAVIPSFNCKFSDLKKVWKNREWTLRKVLLLLSWYSLLYDTNLLYTNVLRYSAQFYSEHVKESVDDIIYQISKYLTST
ncbi:MAG: hypothetical protein EAX86_01855 [Candidatus Heimdallarchaeota archaeon]|nr:hypothetical protein [Candidatus Heimdallarchaeota archaeon]